MSWQLEIGELHSLDRGRLPVASDCATHAETAEYIDTRGDLLGVIEDVAGDVSAEDYRAKDDVELLSSSSIRSLCRP